MLTEQEIKEINEIFVNPDISIIQEILYFDGWSDYEENGGILIFKGIDDSIQIVNYGYCVIAEDNTNYFKPYEITIEQAKEEIKSIEESKAKAFF